MKFNSNFSKFVIITSSSIEINYGSKLPQKKKCWNWRIINNKKSEWSYIVPWNINCFVGSRKPFPWLSHYSFFPLEYHRRLLYLSQSGIPPMWQWKKLFRLWFSKFQNSIIYLKSNQPFCVINLYSSAKNYQNFNK